MYVNQLALRFLYIKIQGICNIAVRNIPKVIHCPKLLLNKKTNMFIETQINIDVIEETFAFILSFFISEFSNLELTGLIIINEIALSESNT